MKNLNRSLTSISIIMGLLIATTNVFAANLAGTNLQPAPKSSYYSLHSNKHLLAARGLYNPFPPPSYYRNPGKGVNK